MTDASERPGFDRPAGSGLAEQLGRCGVWSVLDRLPAGDLLTFARRVEALGFGTVWINETVGREPFAVLGALSLATRRIALGVGIATIHARDAITACNGARTVSELCGGRFVMGLGVSHRESVVGERQRADFPAPLAAMTSYLDAYDAAPYRGPLPDREPPLVLAALGPRMLRLAATRSDGAFLYFVPAAAVQPARILLDEAARAAGRGRPLLVVSQPVVLETDPARARGVARAYMTRYLARENYVRNLARHGFGADDTAAPGSDRLVDALVAWGDATAAAERVTTLLTSGADHVALIPIGPDASQAHLPTLEMLAPLLLAQPDQPSAPMR